MTVKPLTAQQEKFAQLIAAGNNQVDAYRQAYPKSAKWKAEALRVAGAKMIALGNVSVRIKELTKAAADLAVLDGAKIMEEIQKLAFSDIGGITHPNGQIKLPHELDPATRAAVASFKMGKDGIEYKFWDKNAALEKAAKIRGLYEVDNEQKSNPIADMLARLPGTVFGAVHLDVGLDDDDIDD